MEIVSFSSLSLLFDVIAELRIAAKTYCYKLIRSKSVSDDYERLIAGRMVR